jgi:hypothetical protein
MPMFPTDIGNRHCDIDMKFFRSTGGENKTGQNKSHMFREKNLNSKFVNRVT